MRFTLKENEKPLQYMNTMLQVFNYKNYIVTITQKRR